MAVVELQNNGSMDSLPASLVTAWGANGTDPTLGANLAIITAAQSKSVTTTWQNFSVSVTVPSNSKNLVCALWSDSQFAATDWLAVTEAGLYDGSTVRPWLPRPVAQELALCQRFFEKSYDIDIVPGTTTDVGLIETGVRTQWLLHHSSQTFMVLKRAMTPTTVTPYNRQDGTTGQLSEYDTGGTFVANRTATIVYMSVHGFSINASSGTFVAGHSARFHYTAEAEL